MSMKICLYRIAFLMTTLMVFKSYGAVIFESLLNTGDIYFDKHLTKTLINCCVGLIALKMINLSGHQHTIGLKGRNIFAFHWAMFPLTYAIFINLVGMDSIASISTNQLFILLAYSLSVGFVEELCLRGFVQHELIRYLGEGKTTVIKSIIISAVLFGLLHLFNFDKGIYGEITQLAYASFIGLAFGATLYLTKRIYPLIVIHALIDFFGKFDSIGIDYPIERQLTGGGSIIIIFMLSPYLLYAFYLFSKIKTQKL